MCHTHTHIDTYAVLNERGHKDKHYTRVGYYLELLHSFEDSPIEQVAREGEDTNSTSSRSSSTPGALDLLSPSFGPCSRSPSMSPGFESRSPHRQRLGSDHVTDSSDHDVTDKAIPKRAGRGKVGDVRGGGGGGVEGASAAWTEGSKVLLESEVSTGGPRTNPGGVEEDEQGARVEGEDVESGWEQLWGVDDLSAEERGLCDVGLKLAVDQESKMARVVAIVPGSSADIRGKITVGDLLVGIKEIRTKDFCCTGGLSVEAVQRRLLGPEGSSCALRFSRLEMVLHKTDERLGARLGQGSQWVQKLVEFDCALRRSKPRATRRPIPFGVCVCVCV